MMMNGGGCRPRPCAGCNQRVILPLIEDSSQKYLGYGARELAARLPGQRCASRLVDSESFAWATSQENER